MEYLERLKDELGMGAALLELEFRMAEVMSTWLGGRTGAF